MPVPSALFQGSLLLGTLTRFALGEESLRASEVCAVHAVRRCAHAYMGGLHAKRVCMHDVLLLGMPTRSVLGEGSLHASGVCLVF